MNRQSVYPWDWCRNLGRYCRATNCLPANSRRPPIFVKPRNTRIFTCHIIAWPKTSPANAWVIGYQPNPDCRIRPDIARAGTSNTYLDETPLFVVMYITRHPSVGLPLYYLVLRAGLSCHAMAETFYFSSLFSRGGGPPPRRSGHVVDQIGPCC
ncbi:hypothetical protein VUR80DRAFT_3139 [Thermomyces stellatus]